MSQPPEPRYFIAQGENVQGPFTRSRVLDLVRQGKVRADMMFSLEGGEWVPAIEVWGNRVANESLSFSSVDCLPPSRKCRYSGFSPVALSVSSIRVGP